MANYTQKVIHLELGGKHYYFGSMKAMFDTFDRETIGISYDYLRRVGLSADKPYQNKKCIIRVGKLVTTPKKDTSSKDYIDK